MAQSNVILLKDVAEATYQVTPATTSKDEAMTTKDADGFYTIKEQRRIMKAIPFPYSPYASDLIQIKARILNWVYENNLFSGKDQLRTYGVLLTLLEYMKGEDLLKKKVVMARSDVLAPSEITLFELLYLTRSDAFARLFEPIGVTVSSATQRGKVTEDSFDGKFFLCVSGRGKNSSLLYMNHKKVTELGEAIEINPRTDSKGNNLKHLSRVNCGSLTVLRNF